MDHSPPTDLGYLLAQSCAQITPRLLTWGQVAEASYVAAKEYLSGWLPTSKTQAAEQQELEKPKGLAAYKPDFTRCVDHFAIHAGENGLGAGDPEICPARGCVTPSLANRSAGQEA
eukprot:1146966-Pelagomonas_calceolata.AAC.6